MSKLYDMRADLAASIIAAGIGWTADSVIFKRQGSVWNDVASMIAASSIGAVLHLGIAEGTSSEEDGLEMEITVPLTIICLPQVLEDATPEEDLWEDLVNHVHDLRLGSDHHAYRFRLKSFTDLDIEADGGTAYLGRQTIFTRKLSL